MFEDTKTLKVEIGLGEDERLTDVSVKHWDFDGSWDISIFYEVPGGTCAAA